MYSSLVTRKIGRYKWELHEDWVTPYCVVPKGFSSDGASVPRLFWVFADPAGEIFEAAILHDYMYENAVHSKKRADIVFYRTVVTFGVPPWRAYIMYRIVKFFGRGTYA